MPWTMPRVIGYNVKIRREALGMTAKTLGQRMGEYFPKVSKEGVAENKPWPTPAIYMMEAGDRAMVAQEVVALSHVLDMPLVQLFTPPADVETVVAGALSVPAASLAIQGDSAENFEEAARSYRALANSQKRLSHLVDTQAILIENARNALIGKPRNTRNEGDSIHDILWNMQVDEANSYYQEEKGDGESD
jgi:hypothetical protein